jgi:regulatory protein
VNSQRTAVITKIEKQKKSKKRWNVYLDGEFAFGVYEDTLLKYGLRVNDEVSEKIINEIKDFDEYQFAKKTAYDFLSYCTRSTSEIRSKLKTKIISAGTIDRVIEHLQNLGLLNDEGFARELVQSRIGTKSLGRRVLKQKLMHKGISGLVSDKVLDELLSEDKEKELALKIFRKYVPKLKNLDRNKKRKKLFDHLIRKGFDVDIITEILNEKLNE